MRARLEPFSFIWSVAGILPMTSSAFTLMSTSTGVDTTHLAKAPLVGFILWLIARLVLRAFRNLPPGPKGLPIVGDVFHIADQDWLASPQRKDEYGDILHSQYLPQPPQTSCSFQAR